MNTVFVMKVSIIISTHGSPAWLEKVLWGYECQTFNNFDLIIAEDGAEKETRELIDDYVKISNMDIRHLWQDSKGDEEPRILNQAVVACQSDYIIFSNDHCIPRNDFVEVHMTRAKRHYFLSGGFFKVPLRVSKAITREDITTLFAFDLRWLFAHGLKPLKIFQLTNQRVMERLFSGITGSSTDWRGFNSSAWKDDILSINGFNEDLKKGEHNLDFGERLFRRGVRGVQVRQDAICIHLDQLRGLARNQAFFRRKVDSGRIKLRTGAWAVNGISKSSREEKKGKHSIV